MSDLVVQADVFGSDLHMFGSALRFLCNPHGCEVGIDNPETDVLREVVLPALG